MNFEELMALLKDIQAKLQFTSKDGQTLTVTDALKMMTEFPDLAAKYADLRVRLEDLEKRAKERKYLGLPGAEDEKDKFSLARAIRAIRFNDWRGAEFEKDVFNQMNQQRDMSAGSDTAGGYLVPSQFIPDVIELLRAESVCIRMGATVLDNLSGAPVEIPKVTGGATAYWVAEGNPITPSDLATGLLSFTPKQVAALVKVSNRLLRLSNPSVEQLIRNDVAQSLALAVDLAALRGAGGENVPQGIANTPGINSVPFGTATPNFDLLRDMEYELAVDNALRGRLGYVFHPCVKRAMCKLKVPQWNGDTGGEYVISPITDPQLASYLGYPFTTTTQIPINLGTGTNETEIYFGNWQELLIAQWAGLEIMASQEAGDAFAAVQTWVRAIIEVDMGLRHAQSFCLGSGVKNV